MNFIYGKCMRIGSCSKGCTSFKTSIPPRETCRWCNHDQSEHHALGIISPDGVPSFFSVVVEDEAPVLPAVIKDVEKRERSTQFKRAHIHESGN